MTNVVQVGDRLVSKKSITIQGNSPWTEHEALANKALLYVATDAVVAISYSGAAYTAGKNTDNWIAEKLDPSVAGAGRFAFQVGGSGERLQLGLAIKRLVEAIDSEFRIMPQPKRALGLTIQVVGWKLSRRQPRPAIPILWRISNTGADGASTLVKRQGRYWGWEKNWGMVDAIGDLTTDPERTVNHWFANSAQAGGTMTIDKVEGELVSAVRRASAQSPNTVGRDCISILLSQAEGVHIRYFADSPARGAFTPWILSPKETTLAPSVFSGGTMNMRGQLQARFERVGPLTGSQRLHIFRSWPRQPEP